jgi:hypothetical protein
MLNLIDPITLQALAVIAGYQPAGVLELAVIVCEIDIASRRIGVTAAHHVTILGGIGPPAGIRAIDQLGKSEQAVCAEPVALQAIVFVGISY